MVSKKYIDEVGETMIASIPDGYIMSVCWRCGDNFLRDMKDLYYYCPKCRKELKRN